MRIFLLITVVIGSLFIAAISDSSFGSGLPVVYSQQIPLTLRISEVNSGSPSGTCDPGGFVAMRISVASVQGLSALSFALKFDKNVAVIPSGGVSAAADIPSGWLLAPNPNTPGELVIGMIGTTSPNVEGFDIADISFECNGSQSLTTDLTFSDVVAATVDEVLLLTETVGGSINIAAPDTGGAPDVDVSIGVTANPDPVPAGDNLEYTLTVTNNSTSDSATSVILTDSFPQETAFVSFSPGESTCTQSGGTVMCELGDLAAGQTAKVLVEVSVGASAEPGTLLTNHAEVTAATGDINTANNAHNLSISVISAQAAEIEQVELAVLSISNVSSPNPVDDGDILVYTVIVTNIGPGGATAVTITDTLPTGVSFDSASSSQGACGQSDGTVVCNLGSLESGSKATATIQVTPDTGVAGIITNTASVVGDHTDANGNYTATETTTVLFVETGGDGTASGGGGGGAFPDPSPAPPSSSLPAVSKSDPTGDLSTKQRTVFESSDRKVAVNIPVEAFPSNLQNESVEIDIVLINPGSVPQPGSQITLLRIVEIITLVNGTETEITFDAKVEISFPLVQEDLSNVDGDTSRLIMLRFDLETGRWGVIDAVYDPEPAPSGQLVASLTSFSVYAIGVRGEVEPSAQVSASTQQPEATIPLPTATVSTPGENSASASAPSPAAPTPIPTPEASAAPAPTEASTLGDGATPPPPGNSGAAEIPGEDTLSPGVISVIVLAVAAALVAGAFLWRRMRERL